MSRFETNAERAGLETRRRRGRPPHKNCPTAHPDKTWRATPLGAIAAIQTARIAELYFRERRRYTIDVSRRPMPSSAAL
jgi:hypothetical protein